jgi:hypothetical protein
VKVPAKRSRRDLYAASDALFRYPVDLAGPLERDARETLRKLQQDPESFSPFRSELVIRSADFRQAYLRLLTAAVAYVKVGKVEA